MKCICFGKHILKTYAMILMQIAKYIIVEGSLQFRRNCIRLWRSQLPRKFWGPTSCFCNPNPVPFSHLNKLQIGFVIYSQGSHQLASNSIFSFYTKILEFWRPPAE